MHPTKGLSWPAAVVAAATVLSLPLWLAVCAVFTPALRAQVVISELHAAPNERLLRWDSQGVPRLGHGPAWWEPDFAAAGWSNGPAPLGFGGTGLATDLNAQLNRVTPSLYLRRTFQVPAPAAAGGERVLLHIDYDDGFICFLNGREVLRARMGPTNFFVYADQPALTVRPTNGFEIFNLGISSNLFLPGENIIAFQVHNASNNAAGNLRFEARLELNDGERSGPVHAFTFETANGAARVHENLNGVVRNFDTDAPNEWLEAAPHAESDPAWTSLVITQTLDLTAGFGGGGGLTFQIFGSGPLNPARIPGPPVDFTAHWPPGAITAADLDGVGVSFRFKEQPGMRLGFTLENAAGARAPLAGLPLVPHLQPGLPAPDTIGFWRFDEAGAAGGALIASAVSLVNTPALDAAPQNSPRYSADVPGPLIFDPVSGGVWSNRFSLDASAANARVSVPNDVLLNASNFTFECFVKWTGEPNGFDAIVRRTVTGANDQSTNSQRRGWQIDFDSGTGAANYGKIRSRWDAPGVPPPDFNRVVHGNRVFVDTAAGDGNPASYPASGDPQPLGDGTNDPASDVWHHVAITHQAGSRVVSIFTDYQLNATLILNTNFQHPAAALLMGKTAGSNYVLKLDEARYSGRVLQPSEFLRATNSAAGTWQTYAVRVAEADAASRAALLDALNANGSRALRPVFTLTEESYEAAGRTMAIDDFQVSLTRVAPVTSLISTGSAWQYFVGRGEPSGGVWDPHTPFSPPVGTEIPDQPQFSDWIELHNRGAEPVALEGWSLTDERDTPDKWSFPPGTTIPAGGFLLVLADEESFTNSFYLHASFQLSAGGEYVGLYSNGVAQSEIRGGFPRQTPFVSFGLPAGETTNFVYFTQPTPGAANAGLTLTNIVKSPDFSPKGGFFDGPVSLVLTCETVGAEIRYTTNGSDPTLASALYTGPLTLPVLNDKTGHAIRARAFKPGHVESPVKTHTYLPGQNALLKTAPALLITADPSRDLFKPFGIFSIEGGTYDANGIWRPQNASDYNLPLGRERAYERPVFLEYYFAAGATNGQPANGFREEAGLRVAASPHARPRLRMTNSAASPWTSTFTEKPSLNFFFREDYDKPELDYAFLGQTYPVKQFDQLRSRAGKNDIRNPWIKDELVRRVFSDMGHACVQGVVNTVYMNGSLKGFFNTVERYREPFFQAHYDSRAAWDVRVNDGVEEGDSVEWTNMLAIIQRDLTVESNYLAALGAIDVDNAIDYFLLNIYCAMWDWPGNNWVTARERTTNGLFRFYVWDAEGAFGQGNIKPTSFDTIQADLINLTNINLPRVFRALRASPDLRLRFADRIHKWFFHGGALDDRDAAGGHIARRKDELIAQFQPLLTYFHNETVNQAFWNNWTSSTNGRRFWLFGSAGTTNDITFRKHGFWPATEPVQFTQHGGAIAAGFTLGMLTNATHPEGSTIFYTLDGSDPRLFAGGTNGAAQVYTGPVALPAPFAHLKARIVNATNGEWSALTEAKFVTDAVAAAATNLVVAELMYHPPDATAVEEAAGYTDRDAFEFLQLRAIGDRPVDLQAVKFTQGISFDFSTATVTVLAPGQTLLLVKNKRAFQLRYGNILNAQIAGEYLGQLANGGEGITLQGQGGVIRSFAYDDDAPWPTAADGEGASLLLLNPESDPNHADPANWTATAQWGGLPGGLIRPITFAQWQELFFSAAELADPAQSGAAADPDRDGLHNVWEFALGTMPEHARSGASARPVLTVENNAGVLTLTARAHLARAAVDAVVFVVEASSDLGDWTALPESAARVPNPDGTVTLHFRDVFDSTAVSQRFLRVRVSLP